MVAEAAAATAFPRAPQLLVLTEAAAAAVFAPAPLPLAHRAGALQGSLAAEGCGAGAAALPDALAGFTTIFVLAALSLLTPGCMPPAFSSCPPRQPPGHPFGPASGARGGGDQA
eukprot:CAMPEP_0179442236 /NCGR_PEP_ID=MMETSP0799-20121207/25738_1 /TAXON_ID=46947 /ORGANISM="Geminigera cryophila, Strain CCMP2564" /LENGTH=113 /DNA_ID=CAMNT_0021227189 /DNA_START=213 /DNA_END=554 /DNA_ORIENTATION=-